VRWDRYPNAFHGLFIRNDGEPALDISVDEPVLIGQSRLGFWERTYPGLTKEQGELFIDCHIGLRGGHGTTGGALRDLMVKADIESLPLTIRYRDLEKTYLTKCNIVREVWGNGLRISSIQQELLGSLKTSGDPEQPDVALVWDWPKDRRKRNTLLGGTEKSIIVHNRSTEYIYNVQIEPIKLNQELIFDPINEIGGRKERVASGRWNGRSSLTTNYSDFFENEQNDAELLRKGWKQKKPHNRGIYDSFLLIPMVLTFESRGKWRIEFDFYYEFGGESEFRKRVS
jgi:hypothetical protein